MTTVKEHNRIAELNDAYRHSAMVACVLTSGVIALKKNSEILEAVRYFDAFDESNDPYGEHDFGVIKVANEKIFWKIDCYDNEFKYGMDPLDPKCNRVLTIMLASEY